jgi:hypothetical protein
MAFEVEHLDVAPPNLFALFSMDHRNGFDMLRLAIMVSAKTLAQVLKVKVAHFKKSLR